MSKRSAPVPARRKVETSARGDRTFDSYLCCSHAWEPLRPDDEARNDQAIIALGRKRVERHEEVCVKCGAGATRDARHKIVSYDLDWSWGAGPPESDKWDSHKDPSRNAPAPRPAPLQAEAN